MQPFRIPPAVGQFAHDAGGGTFGEFAFGFVHNGRPGTSDACDVLQKKPSRAAIGCDPQDFVEQPRALAIESCTAAGDGDVLARESGNDAIHFSTKALAIEGRDIVPNRRLIQRRAFHPRHESGCGVGVPLDVTHTAIVESEQVESGARAFVEHADTGKEGEAGKLGTWSHIHSTQSSRPKPASLPPAGGFGFGVATGTGMADAGAPRSTGTASGGSRSCAR